MKKHGLVLHEELSYKCGTVSTKKTLEKRTSDRSMAFLTSAFWKQCEFPVQLSFTPFPQETVNSKISRKTTAAATITTKIVKSLGGESGNENTNRKHKIKNNLREILTVYKVFMSLWLP